MKRKFTLRFDSTRNKWVLKQDLTDKIVSVFKSKEDSTRAGVLRRVLGQQGGTVIVRTKTGMFDEERNFREMGG